MTIDAMDIIERIFIHMLFEPVIKNVDIFDAPVQRMHQFVVLLALEITSL